MNVERSWNDQVNHQEARSRWENGLRKLTEAAEPPTLEGLPGLGFFTPKDLRELFYLNNDHPNVRAVQAAMRERLDDPFVVLEALLDQAWDYKRLVAAHKELVNASIALHDKASREPVTALEVQRTLRLEVTVRWSR